MATSLSPNTQAILLLTAPLIVGRASRSSELLKPAEYSQLARQLRELGRQPADLLDTDSGELYRACATVVPEARLGHLLGRGMLLTQAVEQWKKRAIWVISRADADYPQRLKSHLQDKAPAVLYGCGNKALLAGGGLAVVGSRHVDEVLVEYTLAIGELASRAGKTVVSGGAKGIDQAAMRGALENGGCAIGMLADGLEHAAMNRDHRALLLDERLVLVSPFDPRAGFNTGNAMQRNKFIYALADAALVVNSDMGKGGTWTGAVEQLDRLHLVPVYFRSTGSQPPAFAALQKKGALPWPNPVDAEAMEQLLAERPLAATSNPKVQNKLFSEGNRAEGADTSVDAVGHSSGANGYGVAEPQQRQQAAKEPPASVASHLVASHSVVGESSDAEGPVAATPAEVVFNSVRVAVCELLTEPMKGADIATALDVSPTQTNAWLKRLVEEGSIEQHRNPVRYIVSSGKLL